jgi:hypothetical protein
MQLKIMFAAIMLTLSGCSSLVIENQHVKAELGKDTSQVTWIRLPFNELQKVCSRAYKHIESNPYQACAVWSPNRKLCYIYTGLETTHQILGHELRHCFQGNFHT